MGKAEDVKLYVSIPQYFYNIIVPQLGSYYAVYPPDFDVKPVACCPLHDEDTPSMRFYEETNTFYCFGCRKGGDIINLHRLFTERMTGTKPSFGEAVEFLYSYFLQGNEHVQAATQVKHLVKEEKLNTEVDLVKYCRYTNLLESQLINDRNVKLQAKEEIWKALDETEILIDLNKINAIDAMEYIQSIVKQNIK